MTPKEVLAWIREKEVKAVDLRFMDFPGLWQHVTIPADELEEATFEDGKGFDGSSVRGWKAINESDMLLLPESNTAFIDPFCRDTTLTLLCNIQEPLTKEDYSRDPRNIARKAVNYMRQTGIAAFGTDPRNGDVLLVDNGHNVVRRLLPAVPTLLLSRAPAAGQYSLSWPGQPDALPRHLMVGFRAGGGRLGRRR